MERIPHNQNYFNFHNMHIPPSESFGIQVRCSIETLQPRASGLSSKLNFSAMNLFTRFRKLLMRLLFSLPSAKSAGTSPKQKNCDRFEPPKTSCSSSYYSSHSHYTEAIADCIEFFNKSSQEVTPSGRNSDVLDWFTNESTRRRELGMFGLGLYIENNINVSVCFDKLISIGFHQCVDPNISMGQLGYGRSTKHSLP
ncbi:hypothetical protein GQ457_03G038190 [Hibiscus cannabinus]